MKLLLSQLDKVQALLTSISQSDNKFSNNTLQRLFKQKIGDLIEEGSVHNSALWAAHMTSAITTESLAGMLLSHLHNGNLLSSPLYPQLKQIEIDVIRWIKRHFHQQYGHFVAGGSYANLEALWQAKQQCKTSSRTVYCSSSAHYSISKACQILDLNLVLLPTDDKDRLDISALRSACIEQAPMVIIATLGTSAVGAIDPIESCITLAKSYEAWCHVDAAWGGLACVLTQYQSLFKLLSEVDSVCFDPHKGWGQPKPSSILMYQNKLSYIEQVSYLEQAPEHSLPGTQGGEAFLPLWFMLEINEQSIHQHVSQLFLQAKLFEQALKTKTNWLVLPTDTALVCFQPPENIDLADLVAQQLFSTALFKGKLIYRAVFANAAIDSTALIDKLKAYF
jgi:glutamate/tyrosine decarboxylase-like PLP-dependent enzyme